MDRQKRLLSAIFALCLCAFNLNAAQCIPRCAPDDSCILVVIPAPGDTITEGDTLPVKFITGIDLVTAHLSIDSGKSWIGLSTNAITVAACTTNISRIRAPSLADIGVGDGTGLQACKIKISAYGSSYPSGISNGFFFIKKRNSSVRFIKPCLKHALFEGAGNKWYNVRGQAISINNANYNGIYFLVNSNGKIKVKIK